MNGTMEPRGGNKQAATKNYKLLMDPFLVKGSVKLYRYDGVPTDPSYPSVTPRDPRSHLTRIWTRLETLDLPVPRLVFDRVILCALMQKFKLPSSACPNLCLEIFACDFAVINDKCWLCVRSDFLMFQCQLLSLYL